MRQRGFYWCGNLCDHSLFVAQWNGKAWLVPTREDEWSNDDLAVIAGPLEPPTHELFKVTA